MKAHVLAKSEGQKLQERAINATIPKVMRYTLNIVLNILKIDYNFTDEQLKEFYDKFNDVVLDMNEELTSNDDSEIKDDE